MTSLLPSCLQEDWREETCRGSRCLGENNQRKEASEGGCTAEASLVMLVTNSFCRDFTVGMRKGPRLVLRRGLGVCRVWGWHCLGAYWCVLVNLVNLTHMGRGSLYWRTISGGPACGHICGGISLIASWCRQVQATVGSGIPGQEDLGCKRRYLMWAWEPAQYTSLLQFLTWTPSLLP